jgi:1-acyl-sn-glycerol-3-phosphate acyltransferase
MPEGPTIGAIAAAAAAALVAAFLAHAFLARGPEDTAAVACMRSIAWLYSRIVHRLRVIGEGRDPVPPRGPYILVANHRSGVDPIIVSIVTKRRVRFLMAREYYELPILHSVFRVLDAIPVKRDGTDLGATKAALRRLRDGHVIGIFPQGGIREAGTEIEGKAGVALLALRTGAPVVPLFIDGSPNTHSVLRAILTPSRTTVRFGAPFAFDRIEDRKPTRLELEEVTSRILGAISAQAPGAPGPGEAAEISLSRPQVLAPPALHDPARAPSGDAPQAPGGPQAL